MFKIIKPEDTNVLNWEFRFSKNLITLLDLENVKFIDSMSLSVILVHKERVILINVNDFVMRIIDCLNCTRKLKICNNLEEAKKLAEELYTS